MLVCFALYFIFYPHGDLIIFLILEKMLLRLLSFFLCFLLFILLCVLSWVSEILCILPKDSLIPCVANYARIFFILIVCSFKNVTFLVEQDLLCWKVLINMLDQRDSSVGPTRQERANPWKLSFQGQSNLSTHPSHTWACAQWQEVCIHSWGRLQFLPVLSVFSGFHFVNTVYSLVYTYYDY